MDDTLSTADINTYLSFANRLADASATITLPLFRALTTISNKETNGSYDPVTEADIEAERIMRDMIIKNFPQHSILGEEFGTTENHSDFKWVLDPIDGTRSFITGKPLWGSLIALCYKNRPFLGIMDQPFTQERFIGVYDNTHTGTSLSFLRHKELETPLFTHSCSVLSDAILATTSPVYFDDTSTPIWQNISQQARFVSYGGDCYNYAMLATGHIDAIIEQSVHVYDIFALIPLIESAGGIISNWQGTPFKAGDNVLACGDATLHKYLLNILSKVSLNT